MYESNKETNNVNQIIMINTFSQFNMYIRILKKEKKTLYI